MTLKSIFQTSLALCMTVLMASCNDDDTTVIENVISVPSTEMAVAEAGQDFSIDIQASRRPTVSSDSEWIVISETAAKGGNQYTISGTVKPNTDDEGNLLAARQGKIIINAFNALKYIMVSQAGKDSDPADTPATEYNYGTLGMNSSALELAAKMGTGVNIGNTMECANVNSDGTVSSAGETIWGNPAINKNYIAGIKAAGFSSVRIPCSWVAHYTSGTTTVDPEWIARVKQVVSWCVDNDLYVVLNDHYDINWIENSMADGYRSSKGDQLKALWTQIANEFKQFDEHLLFAGLNEPNVQEGKTIAFEALTRYEQDFIDAVRATGGNNATRTLVVQGPTTNIDLTCSGAYTMPTDAVSDRLMLEVHFYDPYQFTLMTEDANWGSVWYYYGSQNHVEGDESVRNNGDYGNEAWVANQFKKLYDNYTSKGIPVVLGEYGAQNKTQALDQAKQVASRAYWHEIVNKEAAANGCVPFLWECGESGQGQAFSMCDFNRNSGAVKNQQVVDAILSGYNAGIQAKK